MELLVAMTLPGLALALVVVAAVEVLLRRRRGRRTSQATLGATGFDQLGAVLYAGKRDELDERRRISLVREDPGDAGTGPVDLDARVVVVRRTTPDRGTADAGEDPVSSPGTPSRS